MFLRTLGVITSGFVLSLASSVQAQTFPGLVGVGSSSTIQNFSGTSESVSVINGEFSEVGLSVATSGSISIAVDPDFRVTEFTGSGTAGATAGITGYEYEGSVFQRTSTDARFSGQTVSSQTIFN